MPSIFTRIVNREIPAHIVGEDDRFLAFLDINPLTVGHTLVIPKQEVDYLFDLDDDTLAALQIFCKRMALAIQDCIPCLRIGVTVIGLEVPHAHVHLIPMKSMQDMNFSKAKLSPTQEDLSATAEQIRRSVKKLAGI